MTQIRVSPGRLDRVANTFTAQKEEVEQLTAQIRSAVEDLDPEWDGVSENKFLNAWGETGLQMNRFADLLGDITSELRHVANVFRQLDQEVI